MQTLSWKSIGLRLFSGLLAYLVTIGVPAEIPAGEGFVRISDRLQPASHASGRLRQTSFSDADSINHYGGTVYCPTCHHRAHGYFLERMLKSVSDHHMARKRRLLGYFIPDGCCGQGCPAWGNYHLLYSANPNYFDQRDGRVYAAQGYGMPVVVPLAPNVSHTYNHGWGIPSSRLTPISNRAPW